VLVLASSSPYRRELLARLGLPFRWVAPDVDEAPRPGEAPDALAARLARAKADAVASAAPGDIVIGSDQVAVDAAGGLLGKPGTLAAARAQLLAASGRELRFATALCVLGADGERRETVVDTVVRFRALDAAAIDAYLAREPALDCAGSFKSEGLGVALFEAQRSDDPTALVGLPLIATCRFLRELGFDPLG
jgi:septum formation protein